MFSQTTEYALRAMACLAQHTDELTPTPALAEVAHVPANYLAKVLQQLSGAGLITGRRGVGGGYKLARPPAEIKLLDVVNAIGEVKRIESCPLGLPNHGPNLCPLHRRADAAAAAIIKIYDGTTLQDLLTDENPNKPLCDVRAAATLKVQGKVVEEEPVEAPPV
jgi:Rrf2 family transcriptional regulator, nitric oxide-sensitive transcriptional repressor